MVPHHNKQLKAIVAISKTNDFNGRFIKKKHSNSNCLNCAKHFFKNIEEEKMQLLSMVTKKKVTIVVVYDE